MGILKESLERKSAREVMGKTAVYIFLCFFGALYALPLIWLISTSLKIPRQIFALPPIWIPHPVRWQNYLDAVSLMNFFRSLRNTLIVVSGVVAGTMFSCPLVGYSFSRLEWPGRNFFFIVLLSTMMIPYVVTIIPIFVVWNTIGWVNSFKPLIIPYALGNPFFIFLLRQFFLTIPPDLSDSARIDGCSEFRIYWNIILPLCKPILTVVAIFAFMYSWRDFLSPLIYLNSEEKWTLALSLFSMRSGMTWDLDWGALMAGSALMTVPVVILFFLAQKQFIEGVTLTGLKM